MSLSHLINSISIPPDPDPDPNILSKKANIANEGFQNSESNQKKIDNEEYMDNEGF